MSNLQEAAQQALAFTMRDFASLRDFEAAKAVLHDNLRAALAQQAEPVEPVQEPYTGDVTRIMRDAGMTFHLGLPHKAVVEQMTRVVDLVYAEASIKAAQQFAAALAQQVEPVEPVAWMVYTEGGTSAYVTDNPNDLVGAYRALPLYTAPPQRKPLTDEEILSVLKLAPPEPSLWPHLKDEAVGDLQKAVLAIARAVEAAHGIGGSDE